MSGFFIWMLTDSPSLQNDSVITQTKGLNSSNWVCSWDKTNQYSQWNTNSELQEDEHSPSWRIVNIPVRKLVLFVQVCVCVQYQSSETLLSTVTSQQMSLLLSEQMYSTCLCLSLTQTFALAGAEAAPLLAGRGGALVDGLGLLVALTAGDFAMHLIGQVPQQTHAVLYQLQRWRENGGAEEREEKRSETNLPSLPLQVHHVT